MGSEEVRCGHTPLLVCFFFFFKLGKGLKKLCLMEVLYISLKSEIFLYFSQHTPLMNVITALKYETVCANYSIL